VISTPQILFEALGHGYIQMVMIALLVFDEAHHCVGKHPTKRIMEDFYHDIPPEERPGRVPHILGLSASPITNAKPGALEALELNLNAICKTPTRHLEELQRFVYQPQMFKLVYDDAFLPASKELQNLQQVVADFDLSQDPYVKHLKKDESPHSQRMLKMVEIKGSTNTLDQLKVLLRRTTELDQQVGPWASTYFLHICIHKVRETVKQYQEVAFLLELDLEEEVFLYRLLSAVVGQNNDQTWSDPQGHSVSTKATSLLKFLEGEYTEDVMGIIFVTERSTAAILAHLISTHSITRNKYAAAPFVGSSEFPRKRTLVELADIKAQNAALADFRSGKSNLLVCTSVMEEGVDVSSMNLVIRFDQPSNFRAFIQSRGRARQAQSKFVLMCGQNDPAGSYPKWKALEAEMKMKYMDEMRQIAQRAETEEADEMCDEVLSNHITG
jgi:Helicase conserved C-terminal domain